jgi:IS5 family transposase
MRPNPIPTPADGETDMFRNRLDNMIDMRHELVPLAGLIDWNRSDEAFGDHYAEKGRPGLPTRPIVGLHLLKHARGVSGATRFAHSGSKTGISGSAAARPTSMRELRSAASRPVLGLHAGGSRERRRSPFSAAVDAFEKSLLAEELLRQEGNLLRMAMALSISKSTPLDKIRKYGIDDKSG